MAGFSRVKPSLGNKDTTVDSKVDSGVGSDFQSWELGSLGHTTQPWGQASLTDSILMAMMKHRC
jgi:hypothetical protein